MCAGALRIPIRDLKRLRKLEPVTVNGGTGAGARWPGG